MSILDKHFYMHSVEEIARRLIGKHLVTRIDGRRCSGRIVETEAYLSACDSASHGFKGLKKSNASMFGPSGTAYVYPIHARWCFNVVAGSEGEASAVLIRAVEPIEGLAKMRARRIGKSQTQAGSSDGFGEVRRAGSAINLARGPARLCEAFGIDRQLDGASLIRRRKVWIERVEENSAYQIKVTPRIGVTSAKNLPLRFVVQGCRFASGTKSLNA